MHTRIRSVTFPQMLRPLIADVVGGVDTTSGTSSGKRRQVRVDIRDIHGVGVELRCMRALLVDGDRSKVVGTSAVPREDGSSDKAPYARVRADGTMRALRAVFFPLKIAVRHEVFMIHSNQAVVCVDRIEGKGRVNLAA